MKTELITVAVPKGRLLEEASLLNEVGITEGLSGRLGASLFAASPPATTEIKPELEG